MLTPFLVGYSCILMNINLDTQTTSQANRKTLKSDGDDSSLESNPAYIGVTSRYNQFSSNIQCNSPEIVVYSDSVYYSHPQAIGRKYEMSDTQTSGEYAQIANSSRVAAAYNPAGTGAVPLETENVHVYTEPFTSGNNANIVTDQNISYGMQN